MESLLTASIPLLLLAGLIRGLKHPFYALHILITAGLCWLMQHEVHITGRLFSHRATSIAVIAHLLSINAITWLAYFYDKKASMSGGWRIPERTLHAFALIGATPSAWLAQRKLRHKTRKRSFQIMFWLIFLGQVVVAAGIFLFA